MPPEPLPEEPESPERRRFLLTNLGILAVFILTLLVLLAAYPALLAPPATATFTPSATPVPTLPPTATPTITLTPTPTRTLLPTFTATVTLTPSVTPQPSQTPTPPGPPTLTPARPLEGSVYRLHDWSVDDAQRLVELMEDYPNTLPRQERGDNNENYYAAFSHAVVAESEAVLRYPDAPQAKGWHWRLAYNLARTADPQAAQSYADLIARALNTSEVRLIDLPGWFSAQEPRLRLRMNQIPAPSGFLRAHLARLVNPGEPPPAGTVHLLVLETTGAYQVFVLSSDFDFIYQPKAPSESAASRTDAPQATSFNADLDGDGVEEVTIFETDPGESFLLEPPLVLSLAEVPPETLPFNPALPPFDLGMDYLNNWSAVSAAGGGQDLQFSTTVFPACPIEVSRTYTWSGEWFDLVDEQFTARPAPDTLAYCRPAAEHAANAWGPAAAAQVMEQVLPDWPPEADENGEPYSPEARDEWIFRMGVYQALAGRPEEARATLNQLTGAPDIPGGRPVSQAQDFLEALDRPSGLYGACVKVQFCDAGLALERTAEQIRASQISQALPMLWAAGVIQRSSGYFDFDGDGITETWLLVQHRPGEQLELWILLPGVEHVEALFVDRILSDRPQLDYYDSDNRPPVVLIDGTLALRLDRLPVRGDPYLTFVELPKFFPDRFNAALETAMQDLFSGADPADVQQALLDIQQTPGLLCKGTWSCDRYYYILGLASELAGDENAAVDAYTHLWWDYSISPYTSLARLKLSGAAVQPSATPSPTGAPTLATTITPTVSGTPATATPTVTGTPPTATPTGGTETPGTPGTTATPTLTPTPGTPYP